MKLFYWILGIIFILYLIRRWLIYSTHDRRGPDMFTHHRFVPSDTCPGILECSVCRFTMECDDPNRDRALEAPCPGKTEENFIGD